MSNQTNKEREEALARWHEWLGGPKPDELNQIWFHGGFDAGQQSAQKEYEIRMRERLQTLDNGTIEGIQKRLKILEACHKRWSELGETECAAIYQGAIFELKLVLERQQSAQVELRRYEDLRVAVMNFVNYASGSAPFLTMYRHQPEFTRLKELI